MSNREENIKSYIIPNNMSIHNKACTFTLLSEKYMHSVKLNFYYEVYATNRDDIYWQWIPLTEGVVECVKARLIVVTNIRIGKRYEKYQCEDYHNKLAQRGNDERYNGMLERVKVTLYEARKTGPKYKHIEIIDLYKNEKI